MTTRKMILLAALMMVPGAVFADEGQEQDQEQTGRTVGDEIHEMHERFEEAVDKGFEKAGEIVERKSEENHSGCNNESLGTRTREAMGCD